MSNIDRHPKCHMRTALGNCDPIGGFCTSVNEPICEALHKVSRSQGDFVSRQYLLAEIDDLVDEFSEVDENGLHSERWCGIVDAKCVIVNAPSVPDRPQGEWVNRHKWPNGFFERECSVCGAMKPSLRHTAKINFCPNCGTSMRGEYDE